MKNKKIEEEKNINSCECKDPCDCGDDCKCGDDCRCDGKYKLEDFCDCGSGDEGFCSCDDEEDYDEKDYDEFCCDECFEKYMDKKYHHYKDYSKRSCCSNENSSKLMFGLLVLVFGVLYLGRNLNWWSFDINWSVFWPVVVIFAGLMIIVKGSKK
jgi:hypothetical protein